MNQLLKEKNAKPNFTEADILDSLNKAIDSYSKRDFSSVRSELQNTIINKVSIPNEFEVEKVMSKTSKKPILKTKKSGSTKKKSKKTKKGVLRFNFFNKSSHKKREASKKEEATAKKVLKKQKSGKISGIYTKYKQQVSTFMLVFAMVAFAGLSTYIAYAYVAASSGDIVSKVASHLILPQSETPKVYIIQSEKSEIFQNPLFEGIKIGDNVLSYTNSSKVIIYRSSEDKVVNIVNTTQ